VCQHGPQECELNRILSCAIHLNPDQQVWFPFAKCLESPGPSKIHPLEPAEPCAQDASINYSAIQDCASGKLKTCQEYTYLSCSSSHLLTVSDMLNILLCSGRQNTCQYDMIATFPHIQPIHRREACTHCYTDTCMFCQNEGMHLLQVRWQLSCRKRQQRRRPVSSLLILMFPGSLSMAYL